MDNLEIIKKWDIESKKHVISCAEIIISKFKDKKDLIIVDVGANSGTFFDMLNENLDIKKAILFEPHPQLYAYLKYKYESNSKIIVENIALSDSAKKYSLEGSSFDWGIKNNDDPLFNLGLSIVNYDENSTLETNSFDNLRSKYNLEYIDLIKVDTETEDLLVLKGFTNTINELKSKPLIQLENNWWARYSYEFSQKILDDFCSFNNYENNVDLNIRADYYLYPQKSEVSPKKDNSIVTLVTGIWDIGRNNLQEGWSRNFNHYLDKLETLLKTPDNLIIYIQKEYESFIWERRDKKNTYVVIRELEWFKNNSSFFEKIQEIRTKPEWYNQSGWLPESTQAKLEWYNPLVMSKMFLLNDARILDPFNSTHLVWVDGALTNTVHEGYFWHEKIMHKLGKYFNKFSFVCFPYDGKTEIHGFTYNPMCRFAEGDINKVARGGIFGGPKESIEVANSLYYDIMNSTLSEGYMGTEESLFTILLYKYPELFQYYEIEMNGLLGTFFENLTRDNLKVKTERKIINNTDISNTALYVIGFNFPKQFETLCISFEEYDRSFLDKPKKFLLNNSTDHSTDEEYARLCQKYGFEEIKKDNIGICGGRQFIAEHAEENEFDFYFFFEDDMFFYLGPDEFCRNGFRRKIKNFYDNLMHVAQIEGFDFLKWNFSEFFGDNRKQWAWHNIPADVRAPLFPDNPSKTSNDVELAPFMKYHNIKSYNGMPYASGEIFYCNWPQVVSRAGSKKMFIDTKFANPFEQTWMSFIYQETVKGNIKPGVLLMTPTEHNRFEFYKAEERREN
jgi:FkbM family methyltransferase